MNPWTSIWTEPKKTIAKIVSANPKQSIWVLAWIYGFLSILNFSQSAVLGDNLNVFVILFIAIVVAPFWGMIAFAIWSWIVQKIGQYLKGKGNFANVRAAFAWSCVPLVVNIVLWILLLAVYGGALFKSNENSEGSMALMTIVLIAKVVILIWSLVIFINTLAQVQKFTIGRSIANIFLAWVAIAIAFAIIWIIIGFGTSSMGAIQAVLNLTRMQL